MGYRVKFTNPATGRGHIDHYATAKRAKEVVKRVNAQFEKDGQKGVRAEYLGHGSPRRVPIPT